jgi:hypothetical protein
MTRLTNGPIDIIQPFLDLLNEWLGGEKNNSKAEK